MTASYRPQRQPRSSSHSPVPNHRQRRRPRSLHDMYEQLEAQLQGKQQQLVQATSKWQASTAAVRALRASIVEIERDLQLHSSRFTLLTRGRFSLVLALPCWLSIRTLRNQLVTKRQQLIELQDELHFLSAVKKQLEDECRWLELRRAQIFDALRCSNGARNRHRSRQKPLRLLQQQRSRPRRP